MSSIDLDRLAEAARRAAQDEPVAAVYLHGSYARGQATPLSDLDIAVVLDEPMDPQEQFNLELRMASVIGNALNMDSTEVRVLNDAPLMFQGQALTDGKLLYCGNDEARVDFETRVLSEYLEFLPEHQKMCRAYIKQIAEEGL